MALLGGGCVQVQSLARPAEWASTSVDRCGAKLGVQLLVLPMREAVVAGWLLEVFALCAGGRQSAERGRGSQATLEATQGQIDGFFSQLPYKCHQNRVASVGD